MTAILSLVVILFLSLVIVRIATVALTLTGLSRETARFQARSAWTGTGFTTAESEQVVNHPVRRRIVEWLIVLRSAGLVTAASTLALSFTGVEEAGQGLTRLLVLLISLVLLFLVARSQWIDTHMSRAIAWALKRYTAIDTRDYVGLLHLAGEYAIKEVEVQPGGWLADKPLQELALPDEGVLVLGVEHPGGEYVGAPTGATVVHPRDKLLLYGRSSTLAELSRRRADQRGVEERRESVQEQRQVIQEEEKQPA